MNSWLESQSKDFDRLAKHLEYLNNTLNKTKNDLDLSENNCKKLNEKIENLQKMILNEKELKRKSEDNYEKKLNEVKTENDRCQLNLNEQIKLLTKEKMNFEQKLKELTEECHTKRDELEKLEPLKNEFKFLTENRIKSDELIKTFEQDSIRLQTQLDVVKRDLDERNQDLHKERMRIETMIRHEEVRIKSFFQGFISLL